MEDLNEILRELQGLSERYSLPEGVDVTLSIGETARAEALSAFGKESHPCDDCAAGERCCWSMRRGWHCC